jgi:predicted Ser/Thr protein kinase
MEKSAGHFYLSAKKYIARQRNFELNKRPIEKRRKMALTIGDILQNRYRIDEILQEGGMGAVYRAWDKNVDAVVAIKENKFATESASYRQFKTEARILANLRHPNLPRVTNHFIIPGQGQYLVMDFIQGRNLAEVLDHLGRSQTEQEVLPWFEQVCEALKYLHNQNPPVIHRDIKPRNIILTPQGNAVLVDFGIAKIHKLGEETTIGAKAVTPGYSPLEQYGREPTGSYSDIYALGATLYTMLTGDAPPSATERLGSIPMVPPRELNRRLSPTVERTLLKSLEIKANDRYQSVGEFYRAFTGDSVGEKGQEGTGNGKKPEPKKLWMAVGGAVAAIALLIAGVLAFSGAGGSPGTAPAAAPGIAEMVVEVDDQAIEADGDFQEVVCDTSHRIEVKLLDANRARIQPEAYSFNWRFVPSDPDTQDKIGSGNYALIYQPSCDLNNQTVIIEVLEEGKTLYTRSVRFDIEQ